MVLCLTMISLSSNKIISMDVEDLGKYLSSQNSDSGSKKLLSKNRKLEEAVVDPLSEETTPVVTSQTPEEVEATPEPVTSVPVPGDDEESTGFHLQPNSRRRVALWPALCETKYHGTHWGKSDDTNSYFTLGRKSYLCPEYNRRDDLTRTEFNAEEKVSPCPQLVAEDSRGLKWAPVIVQTTVGEVPGKVRFFDDSGKTRTDGVFSYMGRSYRGPVMAWLC